MKTDIILSVSFVSLSILLLVVFVPFMAQLQNLPNRTGITDVINMTGGINPAINETRDGIPHDIFVPATFTVHKGDLVTINFVNSEPQSGDPHTFTLYSPYSVNMLINQSSSSSISFYADYVGTFNYYCTVHQPTMTGTMIVLPDN